MDQKQNWLGPYIPQGNFFRDIVQQVKLAYNLLLDPRVNLVTKIIPFAALGYLILPIDVSPDVVPVLGQLDDLAVIMFGLRMFFEFAPPEVVSEHLNRLATRLKGDWTVMDESGSPAAPDPAAAAPAGGEVVDDDPQA
ncbi:MAG: DUF1232 domain-containing protein [Anaerolineales bacterium]|nr:DUF1232 domain-containing protein [Anaerolineales bacterium]